MKKDLWVKIIRKAKFIWREAKKPVLHVDTKGDMTLLPCKNCVDKDGKPKLRFEIDLELTLVYILLAFAALCALFELFD